MPISPEDPRLPLVGFFKLQGPDMQFISKKYEVVLGRSSKQDIDVPLGENVKLSRQHAIIKWSFQHSAWHLEILGKNGASINGIEHKPGPPVPLRSGDQVLMGDAAFHFLLPKPGTTGSQQQQPPQ